MLRRVLIAVLALVVVGVAAFFVLTMPRGLDALPNHRADVANGAYLFVAGGCGSCHAAPDAGDAERTTVLGGGQAFPSPFGIFYAPNISPDEEHGIGGWTALDFVNAMKFGFGPGGEHLYPAFPYTSYQRMRVEDLMDMKAYLDTLPPVASDPPGHQVPFPFNIRRGLGLWKLLYVDGETLDSGALDPVRARGAYLVEALGHCQECHTPRNLIGGRIRGRAFAGGRAPEGEGRIPNITPHEDGIGDWSESDIATALESGFTPDFDSLGGTMARVVRNTSQLTPADRAAIAAYLKSLPPIPSDSDRGRSRGRGGDERERSDID
jgi:mono/diheme cytochrome c family protein